MTMDCSDHANQQPPEIQSEKHPCRSASSVVNSIMPTDELIPTRASLLERLRDLGDAASWNEFYQTYRELIYSVARKSGLNEIAAEEVVQDTVISVAKKMPGFRYDPAVDSFEGWLLTVSRWRILDQLRKRQKVQSQSHLTPAVTPEEGTRTATIERIADPAGDELTAIWDEEWEKHLMQAALGRIKRQVHPQHYEIYHLNVILGKPVREVSRALGVNAGQVYLAKHRVSALLKKELKKLERASVP
jgi:RNA polymerase sigma-70 factor (ECF subfamily)